MAHRQSVGISINIPPPKIQLGQVDKSSHPELCKKFVWLYSSITLERIQRKKLKTDHPSSGGGVGRDDSAGDAGGASTGTGGTGDDPGGGNSSGGVDLDAFGNFALNNGTGSPDPGAAMEVDILF